MKFLSERSGNNTLHAQVTIGTLIFQVALDLWILCEAKCVRLIIFILTVYGCQSWISFRIVSWACYLHCSLFWEAMVAFCKDWFLWESCKSMYILLAMHAVSFLLTRLFLIDFRLLTLSIYLAVASLLTWTFVPRFLNLMMQLSSQVSQFMILEILQSFFCL